jgi:hypothetical protein
MFLPWWTLAPTGPLDVGVGPFDAGPFTEGSGDLTLETMVVGALAVAWVGAAIGLLLGWARLEFRIRRAQARWLPALGMLPIFLAAFWWPPASDPANMFVDERAEIEYPEQGVRYNVWARPGGGWYLSLASVALMAFAPIFPKKPSLR